jgi:hypothetical protein
MQLKPPEIGQTYVSRSDPNLIVYVVDVNLIEADDNNEENFYVEGCDPAYKDDTLNAYGYDFDVDSWNKHDFTLVSV